MNGISTTSIRPGGHAKTLLGLLRILIHILLPPFLFYSKSLGNWFRNQINNFAATLYSVADNFFSLLLFFLSKNFSGA
jgi:lysophospholipase L1-like esterase